MILQIIAAKRKQRTEASRSMRLNIIDLTPEHQQIPETHKERCKPDTSCSKRRSLFEIYKQNHRKQRRHKFARVNTQGMQDSLQAELCSKLFVSNLKNNSSTHNSPHRQQAENAAKESKINRQILDCNNIFQGRLERIRRKILASKIPCIQVRKLSHADVEFTDPKPARMSSLDQSKYLTFPRKPPVASHLATSSNKFNPIPPRDRSLELTPWNMPQSHSRLFQSNMFEDD